MKFRTPSLLKSRKAQFFILTAFTIVSILYMVSRWVEPYTIIDTSEMVLNDRFFIFNNIVEKAKQTVDMSNNCEEYKFNIEEYKNFVIDYASKKNLKMGFDYRIQQPCSDNALTTWFNITMLSENANIKNEFVYQKS